MTKRLLVGILGGSVLFSAFSVADTKNEKPSAFSQTALIKKYCSVCHNERLKSGGLSFDSIDLSNVGANAEAWETVVTKLRAGMMPPPGMPRPDEVVYEGLRTFVQTELDHAAAAHLDPGRTETFHRLNRDEYHNAIRDLLTLDIDAPSLLPADDSSNGFDNMAGTLRISQSLMERYLAASKLISRMAVGAPPPAAESKTYRVPSDLDQSYQIEGLPFGTRGGILISHLFPRDAEYEIKVELSGSARTPQRLEILVDGESAKLFTLAPKQRAPASPAGASQSASASSAGSMATATEKTELRLPMTAGPHQVGATFYDQAPDLVEGVREPFSNPRVYGGGSAPNVGGLTIVGPYSDRGVGETPSRRRIFVCHPSTPADEDACAKTILSKLLSRAYRGKATDKDVTILLRFYNDARKDGGDFEAGIEAGIRRMLVSPEFLFRIEADPQKGVQSAAAVSNTALTGPNVYRLSDLDLASRLSFFIWSSIPDDELLDAARQGKLKDPAVLEREAQRMLNDPRSEALTDNFASQWLQIRNLNEARPADPYSLEFDESLRQGLKRETELFFDSIMRENRPVLQLLTANYTFVNERVAKLYGIPNVQGSEFRRVELPEDSPRCGLLGQGSILTITSHPTRTSPVLRGKWILRNILGTPPPDPPPDVPALEDKKTQGKVATLRERMAVHRAVEPCRTCHAMIDPAGFALESFDPIGRLRVVDESWNQLDTSGALPDGTKFTGVVGLREALVRRPERFVNTLTEKLLTYALGRGLEYYDKPAVRKIVSDSAPNYRFQSIMLGVVKSYPFLMRRTGDPTTPSSPSAIASLQSSKPQKEK